MINWNRLFPPLRQRRNINYQDGPRSEERVSPPLQVSEEQVTRDSCTRSDSYCRLEAVWVNRKSKLGLGAIEIVGKVLI